MNLPNKLTVLRIRMIPIFVLVVGLPLDWGQLNVGDTTLAVTQLVGVVIFALASITDQLDEEIARARDLIANFGRFTGPLADKMLVIAASVMLVDQGETPGWIAAVVAYRELIVTGLRLLLVEHGGVMAAAWPGKVKTVTQMIAIILLFINNIPFNPVSIPVDQVMLYVCLIFTIYSGTDYLIKNGSMFKGSMQILFCGWLGSSVLDKAKII